MEGWDGTEDGRPGELTLRRWRRFGRSGAAMVWGGEAFAVRADGRANPHQLHLADGPDAEARAAEDLAALRAEVLEGRREIGVAEETSAPSAFSSPTRRWSRPDGPPAPRPATRDPLLDARAGGDEPLLTDDELRAIADRYVVAARAAAAAGFDFVDVKACHGYLLHELLGATSRPGPYGGPAFEDRARSSWRSCAPSRAEIPGMEVGVRVSLADVVPHRPSPDHGRRGEPAADRWDHGFGVDPTRPLASRTTAPTLPRHLAGLGIRMVNVTLGSPYYNPHLQRPAAYPPSDGYQPFADPLVFVERHTEDIVREAKAAYPDMFVGTGYTYLMDWLPQRRAGGGAARRRRPRRTRSHGAQLPRDAARRARGRPFARKLVCRTFSDCTTAPRNGMVGGCYPLDPLYRERSERDRLEGIKKRAPGARTAASPEDEVGRDRGVPRGAAFIASLEGRGRSRGTARTCGAAAPATCRAR